MFLFTLAPAPAVADTGPLGTYLRARVADGANNADEAARAYGRALAASADPVVAIRAYRGALAAGDMALARRAARTLERAGVPTDDMALLPLADAAVANDPARFDAALARLRGTKLAMLAPALAGWAAWARGGDWERALAGPGIDGTARRLASETRALLLIASGRPREGAAALQALGSWEDTGLTRAAGAELLTRAGERDLALKIVPPEGRAKLSRPVPASARAPSLAFGTSYVLTRVASEFALGDTAPLGVALCRAALVADEENDMARLLLAAAFRSVGAADQALTALDGVPADGLLRADADTARVQVLTAAGRRAEALTFARALAIRSDATRNEWQSYADLLADTGRVAESVPYYRRIATGDGAAEWLVWMQLGGALEQAGDWPEARAALSKAVRLAPDEPVALNYLAYARLTRGEAKRDSTSLLERAHRLAPDNAGVTDSLGWAYHLTGDTPRALPLLERAAEAEPTNAEIADHLGDAYWTLGRRFEARHAWTAAALVAEPGEKGRIESKMADGLTARN